MEYPEYDITNVKPETTIRSDLWHEMTLSELINQQDLVLTRLNLLHSFPGATTTTRDIGLALERAYNDLLKLIENKLGPKQI